ncbi:MAG TPA: error-prone DNA polymerase, partial [Candidatus Lumbricidophila sp.]|nr:error-prone DNA polymerase [Candidatus Lumbricidophila sp.]
GITAIDPVYYRLPFERFISQHREEEPDIDVDFDSDKREQVIQWVYEKYGRHNAAQVANVVGYRPKMAVRDAAKALGHSPGQQDAWSKQITSWTEVAVREGGEHDVPASVVGLANGLLGAPRHLGIHSGGMVLTERPIGEVVPIERARMDQRTVLQWDKDACEFMGLVKFDLLGLGMLSALDHMMSIVAAHLGEEWTLATLPKEEPAVYDMLCRADSVGVFQVESRAQIGTLPRLQPREFYDLAIEIALIRPGPIQGGAVHPYVRRATGRDPVEYAHPLLIPVLERTKGVPLFQEQLMDMARVLGDCNRDEADLLRRAMGSKRGIERIESVKDKLMSGMAAKGLTGERADAIYQQILSFANFGFAESHALSFALLVYASSWLKLHYPAAFHAALLRAQPMGFYSPQSLTADARRHGVKMLRPDILRSTVHAGLERVDDSAGPTGRSGCLDRTQPHIPEFDRSAPDTGHEHRRDGAFAVRLGLTDVAGIGTELAERIVAERDARGPYRDMADLARRIGVTTVQLEALSAAGAFETFGLDRRSALWQAGEAAQDRPEFLPGTVISVQPPLLPLLSPAEQTVYDLWATGISPDDHPMAHLRGALDVRRVVRIDRLANVEPGTRIEVGGVVTHRQRPGTASGITFLNLEDESGTLNVIAGVGVWKRYRLVARGAPAMIIRGILERTNDGVTNLIADQFESLAVSAPGRSRDFR